MISDSRIEINVPFREKEKVKALGGRWDVTKKSWYIPPGLSLENFYPWLPEKIKIDAKSFYVAAGEAERGVSLSFFLSQVTQAVAQAFPKSEWVKCEISSLNHKEGHVYLEVAEYDQNRQLLGKVYARIWRSEAASLLDKFSAGTGGSLQANMKVLLLCKVNFQPKYGLSLTIEDVDPTYTLGDMAAKLEMIRQALKQVGVFENNKRWPLPTDFFRVAVIAPKEAAGLGDFQEEANKLTHYKLCEFHYFYATFQGIDAPSSLLEALQEVYQTYENQLFDALVIIRGGGAVTDLAWLNEEKLARKLCDSPMPVFTGIGHERDNTILDEIASLCFGTPSKVIQHIISTIYQKAQQTLNDVALIQQVVQGQMSQKKKNIEVLLEHILQTGKAHLALAEKNISYRTSNTLLSAKGHCQALRVDIKNIYASILSDAPQVLKYYEEKSEENYGFISNLSRGSLREVETQINHLWGVIPHEAYASFKEIDHRLSQSLDIVLTHGQHHLHLFGQMLSQLIFQVKEKNHNDFSLLALSLENIIKEIMGFGPETVLQRGYVMASTPDGKVVTSRRDALTSPSLSLTFKDGEITVVHSNIP